MKKWAVETRVTSRRLYYVEAENEKAAETKSCECALAHEEDTDEETISIAEVVDEFSCKYCQDNKIEEIAGGHGELREIPCSYCCGPSPERKSERS